MKQTSLKGLIKLLILIGFILTVPYTLNVQAQSPSVTYLDSITQDEEGGKIYFPSEVFAEPARKEIYVIDSKSRIIIYTSDFFPVFTLDKSHGVENPQGLTVDAEGNLYVAQSATKDNPRNRISVFNACLKWVRDIYLEGFEGAETFIPYRMALDKKGNLYVASSYFPGVLVMNNRGQLLEVLSVEDEGKKVKVNNVTVDEAGRIFIVSEEEGHIYVYDENRRFLFRFGEKGGSSGKLSRPMAVAVDNRSGRIFAVDYMRHTVSIYDQDGKYLSEFGGLGWGEGWFQHPRDIAVDSSGRILVADTFNDRIEVFRPNEQSEVKE
jgi:DNA-binding beta-propeller fold protein YncE